MNTFLNKLSTLDPIRDIILLSPSGAPLFSVHKDLAGDDREKYYENWQAILQDLDHASGMELLFSHGTYHLALTPIGYLIISVTDAATLTTVKEGCHTVLKKLAHPFLCKRVLLNLLSSAENSIKQNIINELIPYADHEVAAVLIFLLQKEIDSSGHFPKELLLLICKVLGDCSSQKAVPVLENFLSSRIPEENVNGDDVFEAAKKALKQLGQQDATVTPQQRNVSSDHPPAAKLSNNHPPITTQTKIKEQGPSPTLHHPQQGEVQALLSKGLQDEALQLLSALIENCANKQDFNTAYQLREWLIEVNPMALTEIIHTAELIENAKLAAIPKDQLKTWQSLVDALSSEEFPSLYHEMTKKRYAKGQLIVEQGALARALLFINSGSVMIESRSQGRLRPIQTKGAGEVLGAGVFFTASVWTVSVKSNGCELSLLPRKKLDKLLKHYPSLESKLSEFCNNFHSTSQQLDTGSNNRREFTRKDASGRVTFVVLDAKGNAISSEAKGNLLDISMGGIAFSIHSSLKKNAIALFGRQLKVSLKTIDSSIQLVRHGKVKAVRDIDLIGNEYSLHIEFNKQLSGSEVLQVTGKK